MAFPFDTNDLGYGLSSMADDVMMLANQTILQTNYYFCQKPYDSVKVKHSLNIETFIVLYFVGIVSHIHTGLKLIM